MSNSFVSEALRRVNARITARLISVTSAFSTAFTSVFWERDAWPCNSAAVSSLLCEGEGDVVGVVAPLGGVAQVIFHGVQVVDVGVQVREHQDRGAEEDWEGQVEVEREVEEVKKRTFTWREDEMTDT